MAWLWQNDDEFEKWIRPKALNPVPHIDRINRQSAFENLSAMVEARLNLQSHYSHLLKLTNKQDGASAPRFGALCSTALDIAYAGEDLLLYHPRLAKSPWADDFLNEKNLFHHWQHEERRNNLDRKLLALSRATEKLLDGFNELEKADRGFLEEATSLPEDVNRDFIAARNLFTCGFDEAGTILAARGLEGLLRTIALRRKIKLDNRGRVTFAAEADLNDLIEVFFQLRWKKTNARVIGVEQKNLLHYLRAQRNAGAHPRLEVTEKKSDAREIAQILARTAASVWSILASNSRAQLANLTIQRSW
jgi:hypothetical protein